MAFGMSFAMVLTLAIASDGLAQDARTEPLRELLAEVRLLRQALERSNVLGARIQLMVARVQLQEQRISELSGRLVDVRAQMSGIAGDATGLTREMRVVEERARALPAGEERDRAERQVEYLNERLGLLDTRRQELASEEAFVSQQLSTEQGRWAEFNDRLERLERSLGRDPD